LEEPEVPRDYLDEKNETEAFEFLAARTDREIERLLDLYGPEIDSTIKDNPCNLGLYLKLRTDGVPAVWAAGRACRTFARRVNSDGAFHEHARRRMESWPEWQKKRYFKMAAAAGINTHGKYHMSGLGAPDDPQAWVSGPDDVLDVAKRRNLSVEGHVKHEGYEVPATQIPLAPDLADEMCQVEMSRDPALAERCRKSSGEFQRLRGLVTEKYGTPRSKLAART
jgi:hypothetical protein